MNKVVTRIGPGAAALVLAGAGFVLTAPAATAAQSEQALTCDGHDIVVRTPDNSSSDRGGWSAAQIVEGGSGTLIPTSFSFSVHDDTRGEQLFSYTQPAGDGHAHGQQQTITCTQSETGTLGDMLEPGDEVPPGADLTDQVTFTLTVTAIHEA